MYENSHGPSLSCDLIIYTNFHPSFLTMLHIKFDFDWPSTEAVSEKKMFGYYGHSYLVIRS